MGTKIEWAEETWNPIIGCSKVSPGCTNCYAERMANRLVGMGQEPYNNVMEARIGQTPKWNGKTHFVESALEKPLHWKKPRNIFVCSMGDLFHETVSFKDLHWIFSVIAKCSQHIFMVLTKRPETMAQYFRTVYPEYEPGSAPIPNLWLGVTAENQEMADERIPILLDIPAAKSFVSIEPMLGPVDLQVLRSQKSNLVYDSLLGREYHNYKQSDWWCKSSGYLDWVICGGESGPGARPMNPSWVISLRDQCQASKVPFMFKQYGEWVGEFHPEATHKHQESSIFADINEDNTDYRGVYMYKVGKKKAGRELDGQIWDQKPENEIIRKIHPLLC